ncbi:MAG: D-glycero-beta-D-manno-heptose-7-phosphate kinase, partial [Candidatus Portnoybacteria bacterium]|nr:D-glycero-beta-D-manno-heptose-7-phosphate kinase [Candidatus Portnoybacteria bacterium]
MNLERIIDKFNKANILVIGDLILDEYIFGSVERISPEAPVPVVWANKKAHVPGGAANVAYNISSLDADVTLLGVTGEDKNADILLSELARRRIGCRGVFSQPDRHTTVKTRIIAGHQQVVRVDWEHTDSLAPAINKKILDFVKKNIKGFDAIIIEDYGKGVVNAELLRQVIGLSRRHGKIICVDPKEEHFLYYRGAISITPNRKELENAVRNLKIKDTTNSFKINTDKLFSDKEIDAAAWEVLKFLGLESILVTLGENGMKLFVKGGSKTHIPTVAQEVFDVSGAGDTVISAFTLALASAANMVEAAHIANFAAGIVVGKLGTAVT